MRACMAFLLSVEWNVLADLLLALDDSLCCTIPFLVRSSLTCDLLLVLSLCALPVHISFVVAPCAPPVHTSCALPVHISCALPVHISCAPPVHPSCALPVHISCALCVNITCALHVHISFVLVPCALLSLAAGLAWDAGSTEMFVKVDQQGATGTAACQRGTAFVNHDDSPGAMYE